MMVEETRASTLCDYGDPKGYSSMARLVGVLAVWPACVCWMGRSRRRAYWYSDMGIG